MPIIYKKGTQTERLDDMDTVKIRVTDGRPVSETPWAKQGPDYVVLMNNAITFAPLPSWGLVLPSTDPDGDIIETINVKDMCGECPEDADLTLHPEAWNAMHEAGAIDEDGAYIGDGVYKLPEGTD